MSFFDNDDTFHPPWRKRSNYRYDLKLARIQESKERFWQGIRNVVHDGSWLIFAVGVFSVAVAFIIWLVHLLMTAFTTQVLAK